MGGIDLDAPEPLFQQVAAIIRKRIANGTYTSRLPSGPALAAEFDLAIPTIRKALDLLKAEGLIISVKGRGTFVKPAGDGQEGDAPCT